jgi:hypothetical protein
VRDAAGELAHRLHLVRLAKLRFGALLRLLGALGFAEVEHECRTALTPAA